MMIHKGRKNGISNKDRFDQNQIKAKESIKEFRDADHEGSCSSARFS